MPTKHVLEAPRDGEKITRGHLVVPDRPIIPFIEGDGTGPDIWAAAVRVFDSAVEKAYGSQRRIAWLEVLAGQKAYDLCGEWLPEETLEAFRSYLVGIKGPLTTPVGGGIRSLNVALRQILDLYVCLRPVRWYPGVPSPVKNPQDVDMVIFRENSEDIYAGIEWKAESPEARKLIRFLIDEMDVEEIRFPNSAGIGVKTISREGTERLVRAALDYAIEHGRKTVTLVHKGNIMKFTEGAFRDWGYELTRREYRGRAIARLGGLRRQGPGRPDPRQRQHRGHHAPAGPDAPAEFRRHRHEEPQRRLPVGCPRCPGGRDRDRAGSQHQLRVRPRHLRGHARNRTEVCRPGRGQSELADPLRSHDVQLHGVDRGGAAHREGHRREHCEQEGDLRLPPLDGRCHEAEVLRVRRRRHREHGRLIRAGRPAGAP
jgi:hypothetical protein